VGRSRERTAEHRSEEAAEAKTKGFVLHGKIVDGRDVVWYRKERGKVLTDHSFECGSWKIILNAVALQHVKLDRKAGEPPPFLFGTFCEGFLFLSEVSALVSIHDEESLFAAQ
jgi:hypothetical protein